MGFLDTFRIVIPLKINQNRFGERSGMFWKQEAVGVHRTKEATIPPTLPTPPNLAVLFLFLEKKRFSPGQA